MNMRPLLRLSILSMLVVVTGCSSLSLTDDESQPVTESEAGTETSVDTKTIVQPVIEFNYNSKSTRLFRDANRIRTSDPNQAEQLYRQAIDAEPAMEPAYYNLARVLTEQQKYQAVQTLIATAIAQQANSARLYNLQASNYRQQGQFDKALENYQSALAINPGHLSALANMAILLDIYKHQLTEAMAYYLEYQAALEAQGKSDANIKNWIADLKLRIKKQKEG